MKSLRLATAALAASSAHAVSMRAQRVQPQLSDLVIGEMPPLVVQPTLALSAETRELQPSLPSGLSPDTSSEISPPLAQIVNFVAAPGGAPGPSPIPGGPGGAPGPAPVLAQTNRSFGVEDCFDVPQAICIEDDAGQGKRFIISPQASVPDLVHWFQFDKSLPVDDTGNGHHLLDSQRNLSPVTYGPGILGKGGSAYFDGQDYRVVPVDPSDPPAFLKPAFTIALWIYLLEDSIGAWRTIFNRAAGPDQLTPALLLWPDERRLHLRIAPRADWNQGSLDSIGRLPLRRWTHIAVTCTGSVLRFFINGIKDGEVILEGPQAENLQGDLYLGRDPWRTGTRSYLDDFRWYNRELSRGEIKSLIFPGMTGVSADFVSMGCPSCTFPEAVKSCHHPTHLCSLQELLSGGFHAARSVGWLSKSPEVWYHNGNSNTQDDMFSGVHKLGICCE